jgi:hypothetical protein
MKLESFDSILVDGCHPYSRGPVENSGDQQANIHGCQVMRPLQGRNTDVVVIYFLSPLINVIKGAPFTLKATTYEIPFLSFCTGCFRFLTLIKKKAIPGTEPNETLLTFRSGEVLRPSHKNKRQ